MKETLDDETYLIEAFDQAEALNILAHDYGLYAVKTRLDAVPFKASPFQNGRDDLEPRGQELCDEWATLAEAVDPYSVPEWADAALTFIENAPPAP